MDDYPYPSCGAPADLEHGCTGCGRTPDPDAAEVIRLDRRAAELATEVEAARGVAESARIAYAAAIQRLDAVRAQRNLLAARVRAAAARATPAKPAHTATPDAWPVRPAGAAPAPEAAPRAVEHLLFVLGGLLLGSAAVVFTAVAWPSLGVTGRALVLATITLLTLLVPPVALRRRLTATAETFAALGLLLVLLDGYAAWYVDLAGVAGALRPSTYAGLVFAAAAGIAGGYGTLTGLRGPRFAALAVAQPVLPLLGADRGLGATGWALLLITQVAGNLAVTRASGALRWAAWAAAALIATVAGPVAVAALATVESTAEVLPAASANLLLAAVVVGAGALAGARLLQVAAGFAVGVLGWVTVRLAEEVTPGPTWLTYAAAVAAIAAATLALPRRVRSGARIGALVVAGITGAALAVLALVAATSTVDRSVPVWHAALRPTLELLDRWVPVAVVLVATAVALLVRNRAVAVTAAVGLAFAVPGAFPLPWWAPLLVDGLVLAGLAGWAALVRRGTVIGAGALVLAGHLVLVGLARPSTTAIACGGLLVVAGLVAMAAPRTPVGPVAAAVALLAVPGLAAAIGRLSFGTGSAAMLPAALAGALGGLVLATIAALVLCRDRAFAIAAAAAIGLGGTGVTVAAIVGPGVPFGAVGAAALLCTVFAAVPVRERGRGVLGPLALASLTPAVAAVVAAAPATVAVLVEPYGWVGAIWSGAPGGVGLVPAGFGRLALASPVGDGPAAVTIALLTVLVVLAARLTGRQNRLWTAARWAMAPLTVAALLGLAALDAPWPAVPAVSLISGLGMAMLVALRPSGTPGGPGAVLCWLTAGSGLAGALATRTTTIVALGAVVVVAAVCGAAGRALLSRTTAWVVAAVSGAWLAIAAATAADLALHWVGYWMLVPAALGLAASTVLRGRPVEARVLEAAAHATAAVGLLVSLGELRYAAGISTLWGLVLGLRSLTAHQGRVARAVAAGSAQLLAYWLLLAANEVTLVEAYTAPAAAVALLAGWLAARHSADINSWVAYGPALLAGFAPSLASVLLVEGEPWRRLALGGAALAVVAGGALWRLRSPLVVGALVLAAVALHEVVLYWDRLPRWVPLAVAGLLLVGIATTYERRLRDLYRMRDALTRMR